MEARVTARRTSAMRRISGAGEVQRDDRASRLRLGSARGRQKSRRCGPQRPTGSSSVRRPPFASSPGLPGRRSWYVACALAGRPTFARARPRRGRLAKP
jgi:hypothetical protein